MYIFFFIQNIQNKLNKSADNTLYNTLCFLSNYMYNDTKYRGERVWDPAGRPVLHMYMEQSISLTLDQLPKTVYAINLEKH